MLGNPPNLCLLRFSPLFLLAISPLKVTAELLCGLMGPGAAMEGRRLGLHRVLKDMKHRADTTMTEPCFTLSPEAIRLVLNGTEVWDGRWITEAKEELS